MSWAPNYITVAQLRNFIRIPDNADDTELAYDIAAASRAIDKAAGRQFGLTDTVEDRYYTPVWDRRRCRWLIGIDDVMTTTGLVVTIDDTATTDYTMEPRNAAAKGRPWELIVLDVDADVSPAGTEYEAVITASYGWSSVPDPVVKATLLQASRFAARRDSPYGVAGSPETGSEIRLLDRADPDVRVSLKSYIRLWGAA